MGVVVVVVMICLHESVVANTGESTSKTTAAGGQ